MSCGAMPHHCSAALGHRSLPILNLQVAVVWMLAALPEYRKQRGRGQA
jgi:hypothetical protein